MTLSRDRRHSPQVQPERPGPMSLHSRRASDPEKTAFTPLATPRLSLVALTVEHAPAILELAGDPEICSKMNWFPHANLADARHFVARALVGYAQGKHYEWGIVRRSDQVLIGTCNLGAWDPRAGSRSLGYAVSRACWQHGYATEAVAYVIRFGFVQLGLSAIDAYIFCENTASRRVAEKLGMQRVDTRALSTEGDAVRAVDVWRLARERWLGA